MSRELPRLLERQDAVVWVDIPACDDVAVEVLSEVFGFHRIAVRDCVERNHVSKVHVYADHVFTVLHAPQVGQRGHVHYVELDQFIGRNYLVTVHGPLNPAVDPEVAFLDTGACCAGSRRRTCTSRSPFELSHRDRVRADPPGDRPGREPGQGVGRAGAAGHAGRGPGGSRKSSWRSCSRPGTSCSRSAPWPRTAARPTAGWRGWSAPCPIRRRRCSPISPTSSSVVTTMADGQREFLHGVIEFYQTRTSTHMTIAAEKTAATAVQQNDDMRRITAWVAIVAVPTAVTGFFGQNVPYPGFGTTAGFIASVLIMVVLAAVLYIVFKRKDWL